MRSKACTAKATIVITALIFSLTLLSSCDIEPIFAAIEDETAISDGTIKTTPSSLIIAAGNLWVSDGNIYKRSSGTGNWDKQKLPAGHRCAQLATDGTDVYALIQNKDWKFDSLQRFDGTSWSPVSDVSNIVAIYSGYDSIFVFSNTGTDKAPVYSAFTVTGTSQTAGPTNLSLPKGSAVVADATAPANAYFATATQIFDAAGTQINIDDNAPTTGIIGLTSDGTRLFVLTSGTVYSYDGTNWTSFSHNKGGATSIAWLGGGTIGKNLLLIGGSNGYSEIVLDDDGKMTSEISPGDSELSSVNTADKNNYSNTIGNSPIDYIFAVTSPVPAGNDYVIYASVAKGTLSGLWSYYNNTASIWDRE